MQADSQRETQRLARHRYTAGGYAMSRVQRTQADFADPRTLDSNVSSHYHTMCRKSKLRPSRIMGPSYSESQQDDMALHGVEPMFPYELPVSDTKRPKGDRSQVSTKSREPRYLEMQASSLESPEHASFSGPHIKGEKETRHDDKAYRDPGYQRDTPKVQSQGFLTSDKGSREPSSHVRPRTWKNDPQVRKLRISEGKASYVPTAPVIPRLATPDFEPTSHCEPGLVGCNFCSCCTSSDNEHIGDPGHGRRKAKMDKQVDYARAYISQKKRSDRLITEAR
ncbi:hypothetical protein GGR50DRAFT_455421 [Xylaria sp. CBS 124048]|nr:hypothetical protein GGR50DRAFT_455421 [Xylaria sp. CBS 124048]